MPLLPSRDPEMDVTQDGEIRIRGLDDGADVDAVLDALSAGTARDLLSAVHADPGTPSELATRIGTSVQNVSYHLSNLEDVDLVRVAGTRYSSKGQEMNVYAPAKRPTAIFVGTEARESRFRRLLSRMLGAVAVLAVVSLLVHRLLTGDLPYFGMAASGGPVGTATRPEADLPVAAAVFTGGLLTLLAAGAWVGFATRRRAAVGRLRASPSLAGRDPGTARRSLRLAVAVTCLLALGWAALGVAGRTVPALGPFDVFRDGAVVLGLGAAVHAFRNRGLLVCWALAGLPVVSVGAYLATGGIPAFAALGYAVLLGGLAGIVLGSVGYVVGAGLDRLGGNIAAWRHLTDR